MLQAGEEQQDSEPNLPSKKQKEYQGKKYNNEPLPRTIDLMNDIQYIAERIDGQCAWYDANSSKNKKNYKRLKRIEIALAAFIPVLISFSSMKNFEQHIIDGWLLDLTYATIMQITASLAGVFLVIINKLFESEEYYRNWKDYRITAEELKHEKIKYLTKTEPYDEEDAFPMLVGNVEAILNKEMVSWHAIQKSKSEKKNEKLLKQINKKIEDKNTAINTPLPAEEKI